MTHDATNVVHAGEREHLRPSATWSVAPPIVQTSVYAYPDMATVDAVHDSEQEGFIYGRYGVPNHRALEVALCELEEAEAAIATTNGSNAIFSTLLTMTQPGSRVITLHNTYGGTRGLLDNEMRRFGVEIIYVSPGDDEELRDAITMAPRPALFWADSIANPTMRATDIPLLAALCQERQVPLVIDNTFATPLHCKPLALGADLVVHSATKFIGGHNDATGGIVLGRKDLVEAIRTVAIRTGAVGAPFEAWLALRGLRTMEVRLRRSSATALALAEALDGHPAVHRVHYPGLASDPGHRVAKRTLQNGFGSMLSIDLGTSESARAVVDRLRLVVFAETLGGVMTTVVHPRSTSYRRLTDEQLALIGVSPGLLRFSIGIESADDLINDVLQAVDSAS